MSSSTVKPTTTVEVLRAARALVEDPRRWAGGGSGDYCASTAITAAVDRRGATAGARDFAEKAFARALGLDVDVAYGHIWVWNDAPERTHAEVLAAFDRAIAACGTT